MSTTIAPTKNPTKKRQKKPKSEDDNASVISTTICNSDSGVVLVDDPEKPAVSETKPAKRKRSEKKKESETTAGVAPGEAKVAEAAEVPVKRKRTSKKQDEETGKKKKKKATQKRTPSSYVLFSIQYRQDLGEQDKGKSLADVSKECGAAWKGLSEEEKQKWKAQADALKPVKTAEDTTKKRKPSSYLLFAGEYRKEIVKAHPEYKIGEVSKICGAAWQALSEDEKNMWKAKANA